MPGFCLLRVFCNDMHERIRNSNSNLRNSNSNSNSNSNLLIFKVIVIVICSDLTRYTNSTDYINEHNSLYNKSDVIICNKKLVIYHTSPLLNVKPQKTISNRNFGELMLTDVTPVGM